MGNYKIEEQEKTARQLYIEYIDRCRRTTTQSRLDVHKLINTRNVGKYYGLKEKDFKELDIIFENELKNKEE